MSAPIKLAPRVFLSFALRDQDLARYVAESLQRAGIHVVTFDELAPDGEYTDVVRRAVNASAAIVVVLATSHRHELPSGVLFEIGAAVGAGKRIFVITEDMASALPFGAPGLEVLPVSRVDEISKLLRAA